MSLDQQGFLFPYVTTQKEKKIFIVNISTYMNVFNGEVFVLALDFRRVQNISASLKNNLDSIGITIHPPK